MKTSHLISKINKQQLLIVLTIFLHSCGSFQGSSYFDNDGIYVSNKSVRSSEMKKDGNKNYYEKYFNDAAKNGYVSSTSNETYFTDIDSYYSIDEIDTTDIEFNNSQIPWGGNPSQTEVILFNNNPNFLWGLSGFAFNYSPFWNNYFYSPFRFGFNRFMSPWSNFPMFSPFSRYSDLWRWRGYDTFYNPYNFLGGFYDPYGLGFASGFGYRNNWFNRFYNYNRFNDYYGNNIRRSGSRSYRTTIARINSGRGERSSRNSNSRLINKSNNNSRSRDIEKTITRFNLGRGSGSTGRISSNGYDRNRIRSNQNYNSNSIRNSSNLNYLANRNRSSSFSKANTNILKTPNQRSAGSGRLRTENRMVERNLNRGSSIIFNSTQARQIQSGISTGNRSHTRVQEGSYRGARNNMKVQNSNVRRSNMLRPKNSTNNSSFSRSYNLNRSNSSFNSGGINRSSSGRSSSSGGRGNTH